METNNRILPAYLDAIEIARRKEAESLDVPVYYYVVGWDTGQVLGEFTKLAEAREFARACGHTGEVVGKWHPPVAYVEDAEGQCVYDPRFRISRRG